MFFSSFIENLLGTFSLATNIEAGKISCEFDVIVVCEVNEIVQFIEGDHQWILCIQFCMRYEGAVNIVRVCDATTKHQQKEIKQLPSKA